MREGIHINRSLLTLGSVMRELSSGARGGHVPYRNSKLTRLLQPALGGNALAAVVCTVSPCESSSINTRATLRFAAAAKRVTTAPRINLVQDSHTLIRGLHSEISALRAQLAQRQDLRSSRDSAQALRLEMRLQEEQFALQLAQKDRDLRRLRNLERLILRGPPGSARRGRAKGGGQEPAEDVARAAFASAPVSPAASGSPLRESGDACCTAVSAGADGLKSPCGQPWPTPGLAWHSGGSGARHAWQRRTQDYGGRTPGGLKSVNLRDVLLSPIIR